MNSTYIYLFSSVLTRIYHWYLPIFCIFLSSFAGYPSSDGMHIFFFTVRYCCNNFFCAYSNLSLVFTHLLHLLVLFCRVPIFRWSAHLLHGKILL
jgi:hypothetical protein